MINKFKQIDCTANNYDSSKPCLPMTTVYKHNPNSKGYRLVIKPQASIWNLLKAGKFDAIEDLKYRWRVNGNHREVEFIEQWVLQYYHEMEENEELTKLR